MNMSVSTARLGNLPAVAFAPGTERLRRALEAAAAALCVAFLAGCGGGGADASVGPNSTALAASSTTDTGPARQEIGTAVVSTQAVSNPSAAAFTGFLGHGTNHSPDGFLVHTVQSMFPINNAGVVAINKVISEYTNPNPDPALRDGFLLTTDGNTYENVTAGGLGQFLHYGYSINDANRLTYQRGPVNSGTPQAYQFFSREAPYTTLSTYSDACTCYAFNLYTNAAGQGVALVSASDTNQPSVVRFDGQGGTQTLVIPGNYLSGTWKTKILADGTIYVGLLNYDNQPQAHEIWRFANAETQTHTVAYSLATATQLTAWDVNETGALVVSELGATGSVLKTVAPGGSPVVVSGTETDAYGRYLSVFINQSGMLAAVTANQSGPNNGLQELLYVPPGGSPVRVLATGDVMNGGVVGNIAASSEMNESGQLTLFMQLDLSPEPYPIRSLASIVTPLFPTISAITPTSGPVGSAVVISGKNLATTSAVSFNGTSASFTVNSATQLTATVPMGAPTGAVTVTTPAGTSTSATPFTVTTGPAPVIAGFSPASGGIGSSVTIMGSNFYGATAITFNGVDASFKAPKNRGNTQITLLVPVGATSGPITVTTPNGTATSASNFIVIPAPTIAGFSPGTGAAGTTVTIAGSDFVAVNGVMFNGSRATFTVVSPTSITAVVPKSAKTGPITVTTLGGSATSTSPFTVTK